MSKNATLKAIWKGATMGLDIMRRGPVSLTDYISMDSAICHGKPCFKGSRVMVADVLELLEAGDSFVQIKSAFPRLTRNHVQAALQFARQAVESGRQAAFRAAHHAHSGR